MATTAAIAATPAAFMLKMIDCRSDVNWDTWDYEDEGERKQK